MPVSTYLLKVIGFSDLHKSLKFSDFIGEENGTYRCEGTLLPGKCQDVVLNLCLLTLGTPETKLFP